MKNLFFPLIFATLGHYSCQEGTGTLSAPSLQKLTILPYDISLSTDPYLHLNRNHLAAIYDDLSKTGGTFYGVHIQSNSEKQDPIRFDVPQYKPYPLTGGKLLKKRIAEANSNMQREYTQKKELFMAQVERRFLLQKDQKFTDLEGALRLSAMISKSQQYEDYHKELVLLSDCVNDLPGGSKHYDKIRSPPQFPRDMKLVVIRPSSQVNLKDIFPGLAPLVLGSIEEHFE